MEIRSENRRNASIYMGVALPLMADNICCSQELTELAKIQLVLQTRIKGTTVDCRLTLSRLVGRAIAPNTAHVPCCSLTVHDLFLKVQA